MNITLWHLVKSFHNLIQKLESSRANGIKSRYASYRLMQAVDSQCKQEEGLRAVVQLHGCNSRCQGVCLLKQKAKAC